MAACMSKRTTPDRTPAITPSLARLFSAPQASSNAVKSGVRTSWMSRPRCLISPATTSPQPCRAAPFVNCDLGARSVSVLDLVDSAAANDGAEDARFGELRGGNLGEVVREDDEIGVFVRFQFALLPFLELRVAGS